MICDWSDLREDGCYHCVHGVPGYEVMAIDVGDLE